MTRLQKNVSVFQGGGGQMTPLPLSVGAHAINSDIAVKSEDTQQYIGIHVMMY